MPAEKILALAAETGIRRFLIDTYLKDGRSTVDHLDVDELAHLGHLAKTCGVWWALAGSLASEQVSLLRDREIHPDCFAVRGDVCVGGREGRLSTDRIRHWQRVCRDQRMHHGD